MDEAHHAQAVKADALGFVQLLRKHAEVCGQLAEGDVRRRGNQADRLGVRLSAEGRPQLFVGTVVGQHVQRNRQRDFRVWNEWRGHRTGHQEKYQRVEEGDFLVGGEIYPDETSEFWTEEAGNSKDEIAKIQTTAYR